MQKLQPSSTEKNQFFLPNPLSDLAEIHKTVGDSHVFFASNGRLYRWAEFGRDATQLGKDALVFDPSITKQVVLSLVKRQAWKRNDISEAQPGKFHHEHRQRQVGPTTIPEDSQKILEDIGKKWGGQIHGEDTDHFTYYGSADVTPEVLGLMYDVLQLDPHLFSQKVHNSNLGKSIHVEKSFLLGIQWLDVHINFGPTKTPRTSSLFHLLGKINPKLVPVYQHVILHNLDMMQKRVLKRVPLAKKRVKLLEFQRLNPYGLTYQGWMDGGTSLIHREENLEGILADFTKPIATIEMQGSVYDALLKASLYFQAKGKTSKAKYYLTLGYEVRDAVIKEFWMEDETYFAMAVDRNKKGKLRKLTTKAANVGELLNSSLFDDLPFPKRKKYIEAIIRMLFSNEFLTPAGIRTRAKSLAYLSDTSPLKNQPNSPYDLWDYQGSETSWIVQTGRIAEGLRKQGFYALAEQLENRILNTVSICGYNLEYVYVGARGEVEDVVAYNIYDAAAPLPQHPSAKIIPIAATNIPEFIQTWTASKVAAILDRRTTEDAPQTIAGSWQDELEQEIITTLKKNNTVVSPLQTQEEIHAAKNNGYVFLIDKQQGKRLEEILVERSLHAHQK